MARVEDRWLKRDRKTRTTEYGKGKRWRVVWAEPDGGERKKSFESKDAATVFAGSKAADELSGIASTKDTTFAEIWPRWRSTKDGVSAGSQKAYDAAWRLYIEPHFSDRRIASATPAAVREWLPKLRTVHGKKLSAAYEGYLGGVLKALFEHALEDRVIAVNPMARIARRKGAPKRRRYLEVAQADALLGAAAGLDEPDIDLIILFMLRTFSRRGETAVVRVANLDARRHRVRIEGGIDEDGSAGETKNLEHRDVPVKGELLRRLKLAAKGKQPGDLLFPDPDGNVWTRHKWRPVWNRIRAATGIEDFDTHELRHTGVSWAIAAGADVKEIQYMCGHKSATMTLDVYGHLLKAKLDEVVSRVDQFIDSERDKTP